MYQKTMMIMATEKDWALFVSTAFCATLSKVGGDLLFAAHITAGIILGNLQYAATLVLYMLLG
jgi:hypothetical protein